MVNKLKIRLDDLMNEHERSEKIKNLKIQLEEKEFVYRMIKILLRQTPYYLNWIIGIVFVIIFILFIFWIENTNNKDKLAGEIFVFLLLFIKYVLITYIIKDVFKNKYFNLKRMNKALKQIKRSALKQNIWLSLSDNKENDIYIYDDTNANPTISDLLKSIINNSNKPLTYRDVYQQYTNIKKQIADIKEEIKIEEMLLVQKDFLD